MKPRGEELAAREATKLDPRQERTRVAALQAAREILATEGWEAVTHLRVAERSGLGRTTLYRHWSDASALLHDAIADEAMAAHIEPSGDLRKDLVDELDVFRYELVDRHFAPVLAALVDRAEWDPALRSMKVVLVKEATSVLRRVLRAGVAARELDPGSNVDCAVAELVGPIIYRRMVSDEAVSRPFIRAVVDDFLAAHRVAR